MYEMQGPHGGSAMPLTCRLLGRVSSWPDPPPDLPESRLVRLPELCASLRVASPGPAYQVVSEFLLPQPRTAQGLSTKHFKILSELHKKPPVIPRGRSLSTKVSTRLFTAWG
jgi:hypothetical protein